jgi:hypothetical protein
MPVLMPGIMTNEKKIIKYAPYGQKPWSPGNSFLIRVNKFWKKPPLIEKNFLGCQY